MTKHLYLLVVFFFASLIFCQCKPSQDENESGRDYPSQEAYKQIDVCMGYMYSDPQRAHYMLDSLCTEGLMTQARCDYFHAMIIFSGESKFDSALVICDRLLEEGKFGDDRYLEEEICDLASNITSAVHRPLETLKYANRGIAICHGNDKMRDDEAMLMARVGLAEQDLGQFDKAIETFSRAYALLQPDKSFGDLIALISLQKKQAGLYKQSNEYDKVIGICHEILDLVERFERDPSFVEQRPENMQEAGDGTQDFANFYKCQIYSQLSRAFHDKIVMGQSLNPKADKDSVSFYYEQWLQTEGSQSPDTQSSMLREMLFLGKQAEFNQAKAGVEELFRGDSLVSDYVDFLTLLAEEEASVSHYKASNDYLLRALAVSDSIRRHELVHELSEQMAINMVQEQQLARQDAENMLERSKLIIVLLSIVLGIIIIAALIIAYLVHKNRESQQIIEMTQQDLNESKEEVEQLVQQIEDTKAEKSVMNAKIIYEHIEKVMAEDKLYLDPELDIIKLAQAVYSSRSIVSASINSVTGKSFRTWLSEYRLSLFVKKLSEAPETASLDEIIQQSGYKEQSTFRRQFKNAYGMTAGEYRRQILINRKSSNAN